VPYNLIQASSHLPTSSNAESKAPGRNLPILSYTVLTGPSAASGKAQSVPRYPLVEAARTAQSSRHVWSGSFWALAGWPVPNAGADLGLKSA